MVNQAEEDVGRARRMKAGVVSSISGQKTIRVELSNLVKHPMYSKYIQRRTKLAVHDPENAAQVGDIVEIVPCRRFSKTKTWRLIRIVRRSDAVADRPGQED